MPSDPLDNNANHNNSNRLKRLCFEHPLQWVLRDEDNELNVNPRHFSNAQNNIVEFATEEVENAEPSSGFHANVNTIEVVADVHRSESGSVVDMLVNFDSPSKELTVSNTSVLNTSNDPMILQAISDFDTATILAALNEGSVDVATTDGEQSIIEYDTEQHGSTHWNVELDNIFKLLPVIPKPALVFITKLSILSAIS